MESLSGNSKVWDEFVEMLFWWLEKVDSDSWFLTASSDKKGINLFNCAILSFWKVLNLNFYLLLIFNFFLLDFTEPSLLTSHIKIFGSNTSWFLPSSQSHSLVISNEDCLHSFPKEIPLIFLNAWKFSCAALFHPTNNQLGQYDVICFEICC